MPPKSSIYRLPPATRKKLDRALMAGEMTLDQLHAFIAGCCEKKEDAPSRSALGRYAASFADVARRMRENREMARALAQDLGPDDLEGDQGRILIENLRGFLWELLHKRTLDPNSQISADEGAKLSRAIKDLSQAIRNEQEFAKKIKEDARKEAEARMEAAAKAALSGSGDAPLTPASVLERIRAIYRGDA